MALESKLGRSKSRRGILEKDDAEKEREDNFSASHYLCRQRERHCLIPSSAVVLSPRPSVSLFLPSTLAASSSLPVNIHAYINRFTQTIFKVTLSSATKSDDRAKDAT